jgi:hypothetical protein
MFVSTLADLSTTTNQAPIAEAFRQVTELMYTIIGGVGIIIGGLALLLVTVAVAGAVYEYLSSLVEYPITTVGTFRTVEDTDEIVDSTEEQRECLTCGVETRDYVRRDWRREQVVGGIVVDVLDEGTHYDCAACASDPVVASLRAQADDPESIDGLDELVVDEEPGADLEDLDDEQLDEALGWIDMGADVDEAVREVAG